MIAVHEGPPFQLEGDIQGLLFLVAVDQHAPGIAGDHLPVLLHGGAAGGGGAGVAGAVGAAVKAFEQGAAVEAYIFDLKGHRVRGAQGQGLFYIGARFFHIVLSPFAAADLPLSAAARMRYNRSIN